MIIGRHYFPSAIMDRNLGALLADATNDVNVRGFHYQKGRKEPLNFVNCYNKSLAKISGVVSRVSYSDFTDLVYITKYAQIFIIRQSGQYIYSKLDHDYSSQNWYNPTWYQGSKSLFDPCPPGWTVPKLAIWDKILSAKAYTSYDSAKKGRYIYLNGLNDSETAWYPNASSAWGGNGYCSYDARYWSAEPGVKLLFAGSTIGYDSSYPESTACSIRCIQE